MDREKGIFKFDLKNQDYKKIIILIVAVAVGIFFMLSDRGSDINEDIYDERVYVEEMENKLETVLESIDGVGECSVAVTLENGGEAVYTSVSYSSSPVLIKTNQPKIRGVAVVIDGADDVSVQNQVMLTIKSLTNVSSSRISVSKKIS